MSKTTEDLLSLKKLNAAYIAALEWDRCPEPETMESVKGLFDTNITDDQLTEALTENQGRRPDEIASEMSDIIKSL